MFNFKIYLCLFAYIAVASSYFGQVDKKTIKFRVSGGKLEDKDTGFGTSDPYLKLYYTENGGTKETLIKRTETINDSENPNWSTVFEFAYDRSKNQEFHFYVMDHDSALNPDDEVGRGWLNLNDYVDRGQLVYVPLYKQGFVKFERTDLTAPAAPRNWPQTTRISFEIAATGLPDKDKLGTIDPYAIVYVVEGISGNEVKIGRTATVQNSESPVWGERFIVNYVASKNQRLVIKIYDDDTMRGDERGGFGYLDLDDYMRRGQKRVVRSTKGRFITIKSS